MTICLIAKLQGNGSIELFLALVSLKATGFKILRFNRTKVALLVALLLDFNMSLKHQLRTASSLRLLRFVLLFLVRTSLAVKFTHENNFQLLPHPPTITISPGESVH